mgnify:CR=1 FL=1
MTANVSGDGACGSGCVRNRLSYRRAGLDQRLLGGGPVPALAGRPLRVFDEHAVGVFRCRARKPATQQWLVASVLAVATTAPLASRTSTCAGP